VSLRVFATRRYTDEDFRALLMRWFQLGCFVPIFRVHGTNGANATYGTEYWLYGDEVREGCLFPS